MTQYVAPFIPDDSHTARHLDHITVHVAKDMAQYAFDASRDSLQDDRTSRGCQRGASRQRYVSAANPHLLRFSQICPRLATFWSFSLLRKNRRPAAQSQNQTYIFLMCRI